MPLAKPNDFSAWQEHFDFLLPRREMLRGDEIAAAVGVDERTVMRLFDDAQLMGHEVNAATNLRQHRRYRRASVILWLAKGANYAPSDLRQRLLEVIANLPLSEKAIIHARLGELLKRT